MQVLGEIHPTLDLLYRNRGVTSLDELNYSLSKLCRPDSLSNIDDATDIICEAVEADAVILIAGDFDADGATASALGYLVLKAFGARNVVYLCPSRFDFGYGLSKPFVEHITSFSHPDLIITVDNGISSLDGVAEAKHRGISVVVTDHHLPGERLPDADAIVNPNLPNDQFPSKNLAGVGVIFYVLSAVRRRLIEMNWFKNEGIAVPIMSNYLDLVALGTVADVVPLDYNNRILVSEGLKRINSQVGQYGVRALLESGKRTIGKIVAEDLAFVAGPRLNASGRLKDISIGIQCLTSDDDNEVYRKVAEIEQLNQDRREFQETMAQEAMQEVELLENSIEKDIVGICLFNESWHQGLTGLIASRIKELTGKPSIVFTVDDNGLLKGSGRSIPQVNIRDAIAEVAVRKPELIVQFGGHAMAAGLTIEKPCLDEFKKEFEHQLVKICQDQIWRNEIISDGEVTSFDSQTAEAIRHGGPWGQGFEPPQFDGEFEIVDYKIVKERHLKMTVFFSPSQNRSRRNLLFLF